MTQPFFRYGIEGLQRQLLNKMMYYEQAIRTGVEFDELKKLFLEIKELEKKIKTVLTSPNQLQSYAF